MARNRVADGTKSARGACLMARILPVLEGGLVGIGLVSQVIIWQQIVHGDFFHSPAEFSDRATRAAFLVQQFEADVPCRLLAAMLARQFIEPPLKPSIEAEVVSA